MKTSNSETGRNRRTETRDLLASSAILLNIFWICLVVLAVIVAVSESVVTGLVLGTYSLLIYLAGKVVLYTVALLCDIHEMIEDIWRERSVGDAGTPDLSTTE